MKTKPRFVLLVTGSRDATSVENCEVIRGALEDIAEAIPPSEFEWHLYHGAAPGVDSFCAVYLRNVAKYTTEDTTHPRPYLRHLGKAGGPLRNQQMVDEVKGLARARVRVGVLAFPAVDDYERYEAECGPDSAPGGYGGTCDCIQRARIAGLRVKVVTLDVSQARAVRMAWRSR